jgi:hypothetical protein
MADPISVLEPEAFYRLRLDMLDVVHAERVGAFGDQHDPALHVDRGKAGITVDYYDDWKVDRRKDVDVHHGEREHTENQHQQRHNCH